MQEKTSHCCYSMDRYINEDGVQIFYDDVIRYYYIKILRGNKTVMHQGLFYCPWCGSKLPKSLSEEYCDILDKEYHIDVRDIDNGSAVVPQEFRSDEWWKNRGL